MATSHCFATPAHVQALLVPVGDLKKSKFYGHIERLQQHRIVRLGDVSPDRRPDRTMFSPLAFPEGLMIFDLSVNSVAKSALELAPFEMYRKQLVVMGIADLSGRYSSTENVRKAPELEDNNKPDRPELKRPSRQFSLRESMQSLEDGHQDALVHRILVFDDTINADNLPEGVIAVPSIGKATSTTIKTVMCDLAALVLGEFTRLAKNLQGQLSIQTPGQRANHSERMSSNGTTLRRNSDSERMNGFSRSGDARAEYRMSMPLHNSSSDLHSDVSTEVRPGPSPLGRTSEESARKSVAGKSSVHGFGVGTAGERERVRGRARIAIVVGSLYLLAGRWPDALRELSEGATTLRAQSDYVWYAKALDYLIVTTCMYMWAGLDFRIPPILHYTKSRPGSGIERSVKTEPGAHAEESLSNILRENITEIMGHYDRATLFTEDKTPLLTFTDTIIRFTKALAVIHYSGGELAQNKLQALTLDAPIPEFERHNLDDKLDSEVFDLVALLQRVVPNGSADSIMNSYDSILSTGSIIASITSLGMARKRAFLLRGLASILLPALVAARKASAAAMGIHPAASLSTVGETVSRSTAEINQAQKGMRSFLELLCESYDVHLLHSLRSSDISNEDDFDSNSVIITRITDNALALQKGSQATRLEILRLCVSLCEALPDVGGVLRFSTEALRAAGSGIAPSSEMSEGSPNLTAGDQIRFGNNITRTVSLIRHLELNVEEGEYWDEFLVRSMDVFHIDDSKALKANKSTSGSLENPSIKGPFIHSAISAEEVSQESTLVFVAYEEAHFRVTLQNLYDIDLDLESIKLETKGVSADSATAKTHIGPCRTQTTLLSTTPREAGTLIITGCIVKVQGCRERRFSIMKYPWGPISTSDIDEQVDEKVEMGNRPNKARKDPETQQLEVKVIPSQPDVALHAFSAPQPAIMLLDGEKKTIQIILQNTSARAPADVVLVEFADSATSQAEEAVKNRELTSLELYELEHSLLRRPSLRLINETAGETEIPVKETRALSIEILGNPGLSTAVMQVDFAHLGMPRNEVKDRFYTRRLQIPFSITVNASLELIRNNILPIDWLTANAKSANISTPPQATPTDGSVGESPVVQQSRVWQSCSEVLLILEFRNSWPFPLTLKLTYHGKGIGGLTADHIESIAPGHIVRVPILVPRISIPEHECHMPIPISKTSARRQFVVSDSKINSPVVELRNREVFWYRQRLLDQIQAEWEDEGSGRRGDINLRSLRLSNRMLASLKQDDLGIETEVVSAAPEDLNVERTGRGRYRTSLNCFLTLVVSIYNCTSNLGDMMVELDPRPLSPSPGFAGVDLSRGFVWNGTSRQACNTIPYGAVTRVQFDFCLITEGSWQLGVTVVESRRRAENISRKETVDDWALQNLDLGEHRIWKARRCEVIASGHD